MRRIDDSRVARWIRKSNFPACVRLGDAGVEPLGQPLTSPLLRQPRFHRQHVAGDVGVIGSGLAALDDAGHRRIGDAVAAEVARLTGLASRS